MIFCKKLGITNIAFCRRYDVKALTYCDLKAINVEILVEVQFSFFWVKIFLLRLSEGFLVLEATLRLQSVLI